MDLNYSDYDVVATDPNDGDPDVDIVFSIIYVNGDHMEPWCRYGFNEHGDRGDILKFHGSSHAQDEISGQGINQIFRMILAKTPAIAIVAESADDETYYHTTDAHYNVDEFEDDETFVHWLQLKADLDDLEDKREYFGYEPGTLYPEMEAQIAYTKMSHYYMIRAKYERHFANFSGGNLRTKLAEYFEEKHEQYESMIENCKQVRGVEA